jgi:glutamine synthetase
MKVMSVELAELAKDLGVKYFLISFSDMLGTVRAKLVPTAAIGEMSKSGAGFAGFATWLDMTPADPDVFAIPDGSSLVQLPWKPDVAWVAADLWMEGKPVPQAPRHVLKTALAEAKSLGYEMRTGVECEFFVLSADGKTLADGGDRQSKPCYDQHALMRRYDLITEVCDAMQTLGWGPYQNDHEDANGQFEMNWGYSDALTTADRHTFFKYMVKTLAEQHGLRATFMPKPFSHLTGNGCHTHVSLWEYGTESNLFRAHGGELGLSELAYQFVGGVMHAAPALCFFTNPTVNSYRRINAPVTNSGATWSPNAISYAGNNRTHMIRIPDAGRFELRLPDGSANPYLTPAVILHAGLDGIKNGRHPGKRFDSNMYVDGIGSAPTLPDNLYEAMKAFEGSPLLREKLGPQFSESYLKLKRNEWRQYGNHVSAWEVEQTLDC